MLTKTEKKSFNSLNWSVKVSGSKKIVAVSLIKVFVWASNFQLNGETLIMNLWQNVNFAFDLFTTLESSK